MKFRQNRFLITHIYFTDEAYIYPLPLTVRFHE